MNNMLKASLLTIGLGLAYSPSANAAVANHSVYSNAVNHCQAFTPGPTNTIRNRVIGAENIGAPIAVACNFTSYYNGAAGNGNPNFLRVFFQNGTGAPVDVNCTLLTGTPVPGSGAVYTVAKSVPVAAGTYGYLTWTTADNPDGAATDLGNLFVGVTCILPTNVMITATFMSWDADNGV